LAGCVVVGKGTELFAVKDWLGHKEHQVDYGVCSVPAVHAFATASTFTTSSGTSADKLLQQFTLLRKFSPCMQTACMHAPEGC
jgi:hypothetical protein